MTGILQLPSPTWFAGCGNMGGAILDGWRAGYLNLGAVTVIRPSGTSVEGAQTVLSFAEAGPPPELLVLAFKPQKLDEIATDLRQFLSPNTVIVSLLAGAEAASLRQRFPVARAIVRAMPNLPVAIRRGVTGLFSSDADEQTREQLNNLFTALGYSMWMADEAKFAALGSVAGSGPAYVARFIAALTRAGMKRGLTEETAAVIARETVLGTAWMAATTGEDPTSIARRVASPNGTTQAGLAVLDGDDALDRLIAKAIDAASRRGTELAAEATAAQVDSGVSVH
jgi:pyrroline-5-carboxylate reductase